MKVYLEVYGCTANKSDASLVKGILKENNYEIVDEINQIETIASGMGVRERTRLWKKYGRGRWRKLKGIAHVRLVDGTIRLAVIHWYEAHGLGKEALASEYG